LFQRQAAAVPGAVPESQSAVPVPIGGIGEFTKEANDMARGNITETAISALKKPAKGRRYLYDRGDGAVTGFCVCITAYGHKTFMLSARFPALKAKRRKPGRAAEPANTRRFIGKVGDMSLAAARQKARQWRELIAERKDPAEHEAAQKRAEVPRSRLDEVNALIERVQERIIFGPSTKF
jgi:Arm DNA-binding domain